MEKIKEQQQQKQVGDVQEAEMKEEAGALTPGGGPGGDVRGWEETAERGEGRCEVSAGTEGWQRMKLELLAAGALNAGSALSVSSLMALKGFAPVFHVTQPLRGDGEREKNKGEDV